MGYKEDFLKNIIEINEKISNENTISEQTINAIHQYLISIKELGTFSDMVWKKEWRKEIYKFGEFFKDKNPSKVFDSLNEIIDNSEKLAEKEALEFVKSEIYVNFFSFKESAEYILSLIRIYESNPEFKHTLHICYSNLGKQNQACTLLKQAILLERTNTDWLDTIYKLEYGMAENFIQAKKHKKAESFLKKIIDSEFYGKYISAEYQNFFIFLRQRNNDQLLIEKKLKIINENSKELIESLFEKSRIKLIEILGFFTAIIAFIFGTITIVVKTELHSALILISSFGLVMLIFLLIISILFTRSNEKIINDKRIWALLIIFFINVSIIFLSSPLTNLISRFCK